MPTPVNPNNSSQSTSGYYDAEGGQCVGPTTESPRSSSGAPPVSPAGGEQPSPAAVDQLVKSASTQRRGSCVAPVLEAALSCAGAATAIVIGTGTGPGVIAAAAIGGALCGVKVMGAEECLTR